MKIDKVLFFDLYSLPDLINTLIALCPEIRKWALYGDLGSGKTTLTNEFIKALGSLDAASSPTYSIINIYNLKEGQEIAHMDFYRLKSKQEIIDIGAEEIILDEKNICFVEWPELIETWIDHTWAKVYFETMNDSVRMIRLCLK